MDLIRDFKDPGREYSVLAFWFLNGELKKERLAWQIGQMVEKGVYGGFMHPRAYLKTPYLEDEWWDAVGVCVEESRKQGFAPWLYDEYAWPSGTAGSTFDYGFQKPSRILSRGRDNMAKGLWAVKKMPGIGAAGMKVPEMRAAEIRAAEIRAAPTRMPPTRRIRDKAAPIRPQCRTAWLKEMVLSMSFMKKYLKRPWTI